MGETIIIAHRQCTLTTNLSIGHSIKSWHYSYLIYLLSHYHLYNSCDTDEDSFKQRPTSSPLAAILNGYALADAVASSWCALPTRRSRFM